MATILAILSSIGAIAAFLNKVLPDPKQRAERARLKLIQDQARRQEQRLAEEKELGAD